ncbi:Hypothetical predicted protein [Octopus vulgaris]|uniref:Uncharacterized protein n=1 Tax=Octopus vulgaris TaxID=6645 RepID=A0AA36BXB8_OCTVU|nr:Hypothetical predicted protein [Octopus vulgaris]
MQPGCPVEQQAGQCVVNKLVFDATRYPTQSSTVVAQLTLYSGYILPTVSQTFLFHHHFPPLFHLTLRPVTLKN